MDAKVQGYVAELREQNTALSDRAGQLAAALAEARELLSQTQQKLTEAQEKISALEKDTEKES